MSLKWTQKLTQNWKKACYPGLVCLVFLLIFHILHSKTFGYFCFLFFSCCRSFGGWWICRFVPFFEKWVFHYSLSSLVCSSRSFPMWRRRRQAYVRGVQYGWRGTPIKQHVEDLREKGEGWSPSVWVSVVLGRGFGNPVGGEVGGSPQGVDVLVFPLLWSIGVSAGTVFPYVTGHGERDHL